MHYSGIKYICPINGRHKKVGTFLAGNVADLCVSLFIEKLLPINRKIDRFEMRRIMNNSKNESKYISTIVMSVLVILFVVCYTIVSNATQSISEMESEKHENEQQMSSYQEQASDLLETKSALENLVSGLNSELWVIGEKIDDIEQEIAQKNNELESIKISLEQAKEDEIKQYEDMKLRIKFMYEMRGDSYMDIMLSGTSIADSLNKAEYVSKLVEYDRKMLEKYKETKQQIQENENAYQKEQEELMKLMEELAEQRQLINDKIVSTNEQILLYADDIAKAEQEALEYEKKIAANQLAIDDESRRIEESSILEAESIAKAKRERESREQERRERESIAESKRQAGIYEEDETTSPQEGEDGEHQTSSSGGKINFEVQGNDVDMLAALIECEAGDQSYFGMLCVGAVVINRINSPNFPNTLYEVIYQPYQFTPVTVSGRFALVFARGAEDICYKAAREVLEEGNIVGSWLFFRMNDGSRQGEVIGDHVFY